MDLPPMPDFLAAMETQWHQQHGFVTPETRVGSRYYPLARSLLAQYVAAYPNFPWYTLMSVVDVVYADLAYRMKHNWRSTS